MACIVKDHMFFCLYPRSEPPAKRMKHFSNQELLPAPGLALPLARGVDFQVRDLVRQSQSGAVHVFVFSSEANEGGVVTWKLWRPGGELQQHFDTQIGCFCSLHNTTDHILSDLEPQKPWFPKRPKSAEHGVAVFWTSPCRAVLNGKKKLFRYMVFSKTTVCSSYVQPWLVAIGGWRLVEIAGWRLAVGGWRRLAAVGSW